MTNFIFDEENKSLSPKIIEKIELCRDILIENTQNRTNKIKTILRKSVVFNLSHFIFNNLKKDIFMSEEAKEAVVQLLSKPKRINFLNQFNSEEKKSLNTLSF